MHRTSIAGITLLVALQMVPCGLSWGQTFWERSSGPYGPARAMAVDASGTLYAAMYSSDYGPSGFVYRYIAENNTWVETGLRYSNVSPSAMALAANGDILIPGNYAEALFPAGVMRLSTDSLTWRKTTPFDNTYVCSIIVVDGGTVYVGAHNGVYRSFDNGESFDWIGPSEDRYCSLAYGNGWIYAGSANGLFRSSGGNRRWESFGLSGHDIISLFVDGDDAIYVGTQHGVFTSGLMAPSFDRIGFEGLTVRALMRTPSGELLAGVDPTVRDRDGGIFSSADEGATWSRVAADGRWVWKFLEKESIGVFAQSSTGVYLREIGSPEWRISGLPNTTVYQLDAASNGVLFSKHSVNGTGGGISYSADRGDTWTRMGSGRRFYLGPGNELYLTPSTRVLAYTDDQGESFEKHDLPDGFHDELVVNSRGELYASAQYPEFDQDHGIYRSQDNGKTWLRVGLPGIDIRILTIDPLDRVWAADIHEIYRSDPYGENWILITPRIQGSRSLVTGIWFSKRGTVFVEAGDLYRSIDDGSDFESVLDRPSFTDMVENELGILYASAGRRGVKVSFDDGATWSDFNDGFDLSVRGGFNVESIAINPEGYLFVGTISYGVYRSIESSVTFSTDVASSRELTDGFGLELFPNPTRGNTSLLFTLARPENISVDLHDLLGRKLGTFFRDRLTAGQHYVPVNLSDFSSGLYVISLHSGPISRQRIVTVNR